MPALFFVLLIVQEIQPSGPNGPTVTVGDYVRDLLLEQVSELLLFFKNGDASSAKAAVCSTAMACSMLRARDGTPVGVRQDSMSCHAGHG